jgi:hypothetical protein
MEDNRIMKWFGGSLVTATFVLAGVAAWSPGVLAQAPTAAMQVGATVAPQCRIVVDEPATDADRSPSVRVTCGRRGLRVLRVSSSSGTDSAARQLAAMELSGMRAGGEVAFVVPHALATVASRDPFVAPPAAREPVVITLDF